MKLLNRSIAGLGLILAVPASAHAQSVKMADLAGTWATTSRKGIFQNCTDTLAFRSDTMFRWEGYKEFQRVSRFRGDSIVFVGGQGFKITIKDQQLTLTGVEGEFVGKRVDAPKPTP